VLPTPAMLSFRSRRLRASRMSLYRSSMGAGIVVYALLVVVLFVLLGVLC